MKISYGVAGFFAGAFIGLLMGLVEMRIIDHSKHPAMMFLVIALTVIICGIAGLVKGLNIFRKKMNKG